MNVTARTIPLLLLFTAIPALAEEPAFAPVTGPRLREALTQSVPSVTWSHVPYRQAWKRLSQEYRVAVLLDRRIDPSREIDFTASNTTVAEIVEKLATESRAEARVAGNTVYVGPSEPAGKLRTLIRLRTDELTALASGEAGLDVLARRTVRWNDLDRPLDVLQKIAGTWRMRIENPEAIPHDLWAGSVLPDVTVAEALSLVLIPFDRTFAWTDGGRGIRIVPVPDVVEVSDVVAVPRGVGVAEAVRDWPERIPGLRAEAAGRRVRVFGTVETLEALAADLDGDAPSVAESKPSPADTPGLDRRRFTLRVQQVPVNALMKKLEESGIRFAYDAGALKAADVDLTERIDVDVQDATPEAFFEAIFEPLGVDFAIEGVTVELSPAKDP